MNLIFNESSFINVIFVFVMFLGVEGTKLLMPALSPTMEEGTILKWLKQEGKVCYTFEGSRNILFPQFQQIKDYFTNIPCLLIINPGIDSFILIRPV